MARVGPGRATRFGESPPTPPEAPDPRRGPVKAFSRASGDRRPLANTENKSPGRRGVVAPRAPATAQEQPAYIRMCGHNPEARGSYHLWTWTDGSPQKTRVPYLCGSWRCPHCERYAASVLFARVTESFEPYAPTDCVFAVLTLESIEHARAQSDLAGVYRDLTRRAERWRKRVDRWLHRMGCGKTASRWIATVEAHRSGVPHLNLILHNPDLAAMLREQARAKQALGLSVRESTLLDGELLRHAEACGFGWSSTAEAVRAPAIQSAGVSALAGYIAKVAKRADKLHAEVAKLTQLPLQAPKNFRRVRAGKHFLVPKRTSGCTGCVVRRVWTHEGDQVVEPLVWPRDPIAREQVQLVCLLETALARADESQIAERGYRTGREQKVRRFRGTTEVRAGPDPPC